LKQAQFVVHPTNRGWTRDSGPIHVVRKRATSSPAIVHFHFNAWAKYKNWRLDTTVPETAAKLLNRPLFDARCNGRKFIIEGGGIEVNGRGTLFTTEECYLHPTVQVRNPGVAKTQYEDAFKKYLGVKNVLWLAAGPVGDDTHGHIDDIARFVNPKTLVLIRQINATLITSRWRRIGSACRICVSKTAQSRKLSHCRCRRLSITRNGGCRRATRISTSATPA
jgi:agmatine deiminase